MAAQKDQDCHYAPCLLFCHPPNSPIWIRVHCCAWAWSSLPLKLCDVLSSHHLVLLHPGQQTQHLHTKGSQEATSILTLISTQTMFCKTFCPRVTTVFSANCAFVLCLLANALSVVRSADGMTCCRGTWERLDLVMTGEARSWTGMNGNILSGKELSLSTRVRRHKRRSRRMSRSADVKDDKWPLRLLLSVSTLSVSLWPSAKLV